MATILEWQSPRGIMLQLAFPRDGEQQGHVYGSTERA
jgi:hypothetical protein